MLLPDTYRSEGKILPTEKSSSQSGGLGAMGGAAASAAASALGMSIPGTSDQDANYVDIINSRWMGKLILNTPFTFSYRRFVFMPARVRTQTLTQFYHIKHIEAGLKKMREILTVDRSLKTKSITITAETPSPELSQQVVQASIDLLNEFVVKKSVTKGSQNAQFTQKRLDDVREEYWNAQAALLSFQSDKRNYLTSTDPAIRLKGLRLDNELKTYQELVTTLTVSHEQALLQEKSDMPIINVLDSGDVPDQNASPHRATAVLMAFLVAFGGSLLLDHRKAVLHFLNPARS